MAKAKPKIDLEADAKKPAPTTRQLSEVSALVKRMLSLELQQTAKQLELTELGQRIERLSSTEIPEAMKLIGLKYFELDDGHSVEIKEGDYGSYNKDSEPAVFKWLHSHGHGDLIKSTLDVIIGKGKEHIVTKLQKVLSQKAYDGCVVEFKEAVHSSTFKAFVREQLEEGKTLPKQIAIFHKMETIIKEPKNGKASASNKKQKPTSSKTADRF